MLILLVGSLPLVAQTVSTFEGIGAAQLTNPTFDPDPNGAVGTKQFMEWVNVAYQAYDKVTFAPVWSTPQSGTTPWRNAGLTNCTNITGDGYVLFDRLASRWVIAGRSSSLGVYYYCVAISNTDDLSSSTLNWFTYAIALNSFLGKNSQGTVYFPDWPKLATWADAYYLSIDLEDNNNNFQEVGVVTCALDRVNMLVGGTPRSTQCFRIPPSGGAGVYLSHSLIPADVEGTTPPPVGRDEYFVSIQNPIIDGVTTTSSLFNIWDFHVDWLNPANSTFVQSTQPVAPYTPGCYSTTSPANTICVPESTTSATGKRLDSVGDRFMPRLAYRNFPTYESFLFSHAILVGAGSSKQTGIRWYELRGAGTPALFQNGTVNPDQSLFRFMPSIAQDNSGEAAVGYSVSNGSTHPGISASWWNLGSLTAPSEFSLFAGSGDQENASQWGDYTSMTVDPINGCTFWYVNEYLDQNQTGNQHVWKTRISNFQLPGCGVPVTLSSTSLSFGNVVIHTSSTAPAVTLTNNQNVALTNISITANAPFSQVNTCGTSIAAGAQCKITITFSPTVTGGQSGTVSISDSASTSPQTIAVKGTGVNPVTFNPSSLNFGAVAVGTSSSPMTTTLMNRQKIALNITAISITGLNSADFSQTNNCPSSVAAGGSCAITVTFTPHATGSRSGNVKVTDDASTNPQIVRLAGTGN